MQITPMLPLPDKATRPLAWWLAVLCAALPLLLVVMAVGGALRQGFGEWRWVYLAILFVTIAVTMQLMSNRPWLLYLVVVVAVTYIGSVVAYATLAWVVMERPQALGLSQWLFAVFLVPTHLVFVTYALVAGLLALVGRRLF